MNSCLNSDHFDFVSPALLIERRISDHLEIIQGASNLNMDAQNLPRNSDYLEIFSDYIGSEMRYTTFIHLVDPFKSYLGISTYVYQCGVENPLNFR